MRTYSRSTGLIFRRNLDGWWRDHRVSHQNLKSDICVASWQAIVRARRGGSKATINVRSASRGGFELFYTREDGSPPEGWRDARSRALRRIRATAPRLATRLHNRYPAYTCASPRVRTCVRARKKVRRCVRVNLCVCTYVCGARKRLFVAIRCWNIRVMRPAENRTDSLHIESDIVARIVNALNDFKIDCRTSI